MAMLLALSPSARAQSFVSLKTKLTKTGHLDVTVMMAGLPPSSLVLIDINADAIMDYVCTSDLSTGSSAGLDEQTYVAGTTSRGGFLQTDVLLPLPPTLSCSGTIKLLSAEYDNAVISAAGISAPLGSFAATYCTLNTLKHCSSVN
jgi:hypothetical protein